AEGDTVRLKSLGRDAVIKRKVDENTFEVEAGIMKMRVPRSDIAIVVRPAAAEKALNPVAAARARGISVSLRNEDDDSGMPGEINVIGQTVDGATGSGYVMRLCHGCVTKTRLSRHENALDSLDAAISCGTSSKVLRPQSGLRMTVLLVRQEAASQP